MAGCSAITASGTRCRGVPVRGSDLCAAHHPDHSQRRKAGARRGGRARGASELAAIKAQLAALYADVLAGEVERGVAAVAAQISNVQLRAVDLEYRTREADAVAAQVEELRALLESA